MTDIYEPLRRLIPDFDADRVLIMDTECFRNFWSIGFYRLSDGKVLAMEHSHRREIDRDRVYRLMMQNFIVTFNGNHYDMPMIWKMLDGASPAQLKQANDRIIVGGMKPWHAPEVLGVTVPRDCYIRKDGSRSPGLWHTDLKEVNPDPFQGLKTLAGRLHAPKMQDLPYSPDAELTEEEMDIVLGYMGNDLQNTRLLFDALIEPLALRAAASREYGINLMSKSDSQMGEAIVKRRVEEATGEKIVKVDTPPGTPFHCKLPDYLVFDNPELTALVDRIRSTEMYVSATGKVELPDFLDGREVQIGETVYAMGIGGLHSTEKNRSVHSDDDNDLTDADAGSFYPNMIINSGLYPKSCGPAYIPVARKIKDDRMHAKRTGEKVTAETLKIALNGALFGKGGSPYSVLHAPHLMVTVTLTGQLVLLMLINRAERAGIPVVSANTDGVIFRCPTDRKEDLAAICKQWEADTGFELEYTPYRAVYNQSVNSYIAVKDNGKAKLKGPIANPWREGDMRGMLMKNPQMTVVSNAVVDLITKGLPIEETIRASRDIREFVTVVKVTGGATWRGEYLGKVVRYLWSTDGTEILRAVGHKTTGTHGKVSKTDGCRPVMDLPEEFPDDIDYDAYIRAAEEMLMDYGYHQRPDPIKPIRIHKWSALAWFAIAAA